MNEIFPDIDENIKRILFEIGEAKVRHGRENDSIRVMAVTKTVPPERVCYAVSKGFDLLGENRVQEYLSKKDSYPENVQVHFIGHLQSNKIKDIIDSVSMIQSVDGIHLAESISAMGEKRGRVTDILCEVNIGGEPSKSGFSPEETPEALYRIAELKGVRLKGLMTVPPPSENTVFLEKMQRLYEDMKSRNIKGAEIEMLSMGMSGDFSEAIGFGTDLVRLGTALFGARAYRQTKA